MKKEEEEKKNEAIVLTSFHRFFLLRRIKEMREQIYDHKTACWQQKQQ